MYHLELTNRNVILNTEIDSWLRLAALRAKGRRRGEEKMDILPDRRGTSSSSEAAEKDRNVNNHHPQKASS